VGVLGLCLGWSSRMVRPHQGTDSPVPTRAPDREAVAASLPARVSALSGPPWHRSSCNLSF